MQTIVRFLTILVVIVCIPFSAYAQIDADLLLNFEASHIVGTGQTINVHRVPVTDNETNQTILKDVFIDFGVTADGSVIVTNITSMTSVPLPNSASSIIPGIYVSAEGFQYSVSVGGVTADGRVSGSIQSITTNVVFNGTWVTGPVAGHPLIGRLVNDLELDDGPTYGLVGVTNFAGITTDLFCQGYLLAISQIGTSLVLTAYHQLSTPSSPCSTASNTNFGVANFTLIPVPEEP